MLQEQYYDDEFDALHEGLQRMVRHRQIPVVPRPLATDIDALQAAARDPGDDDEDDDSEDTQPPTLGSDVLDRALPPVENEVDSNSVVDDWTPDTD